MKTPCSTESVPDAHALNLIRCMRHSTWIGDYITFQRW